MIFCWMSCSSRSYNGCLPRHPCFLAPFPFTQFLVSSLLLPFPLIPVSVIHNSSLITPFPFTFFFLSPFFFLTFFLPFHLLLTCVLPYLCVYMYIYTYACVCSGLPSPLKVRGEFSMTGTPLALFTTPLHLSRLPLHYTYLRLSPSLLSYHVLSYAIISTPMLFFPCTTLSLALLYCPSLY